MSLTPTNLTLSRIYEIIKDACAFSLTNPKCLQVNTFAVLYEFDDLNKESLGMKPEDSNTPIFWTRGSVSLNEVSVHYPMVNVFDYAGVFEMIFDPECQQSVTHHIRIMVSDVIVPASIGLSLDCDGRNVTKIFEDTETILSFILKYINGINLYAIVNLDSSITVKWENKQKLDWMVTMGLITSYAGSESYKELSANSYWYKQGVENLNKSKRFERLRHQTKDDIAATYIDISIPIMNSGDIYPVFYEDTNMVNAKG